MTPDETAATRATAERLVVLETELELCARILTEVASMFGEQGYARMCRELKGSAEHARSILNPVSGQQ